MIINCKQKIDLIIEIPVEEFKLNYETEIRKLLEKYDIFSLDIYQRRFDGSKYEIEILFIETFKASINIPLEVNKTYEFKEIEEEIEYIFEGDDALEALSKNYDVSIETRELLT